MSASLELDGMRELREALRDVPSTLREETLRPVVDEAAASMVADVQGGYHRVTGTLADRVVQERMRNGIGVKVRTKAPHAWLYEYGSVRGERFTKGGASRGTMPAQPTFIPAAIRARNRMVDAAKSALRSLKVPGFDGTLDVRE